MTSTPTSGHANSTPKRMNKMASNQAMNLNHLLNFTLPPRQTRPMTSIPKRSRKTGTGQGVWNKERFINAQYRFVMNPSGDYTVHFADPDIFFQWQDILQIIVPRSSPLARAAESDEESGRSEGFMTCPICISPPIAPRMTKCGHVFCFPCILHYLSTSENKWARCPICFDSVNERQLKSVKWYEGPPVPAGEPFAETRASPLASSSTANLFETIPRPGSTLRMRLIQRPQITTLALPRSKTWPSDLLPPHQAPFHFLPDVFSFAKFMLATPEYLISDLSRELDQLADERRILGGMSDDLSLYFVNNAEEKVQHQIAKAAALETSVLKEQTEKARRDLKEIWDRVAFQRNKAENTNRPSAGPSEVPDEFLALRSTTSGDVSGVAKAQPRLPAQGRSNMPRPRRNINPPPPSTSTYYYYQAASGLPIFLHPLDIKVLLSHFNGYSSFPEEITVRVDAVSEGTVDDDLRKRCKYLAHLPEGADVISIEADLEAVVGAEGLRNFEGVLKMRAAKRKDKEKKEDRAKLRAEEREKQKEREALARYTPSNRTPSSMSLPSDSALHPTSSPEPEPTISSPVVSGAWGQRSFASTLHASSSVPVQRRPKETTEEEWDVEGMWHDLEQRAVAAGSKKKKGARMVVLGGPGGRRR